MPKVLCVFEGGGAKGVSHLGALDAIESEETFEVCGVAGTSAGSIVAALAAAGYKSREMFNYDPQSKSSTSIFDFLGDPFNTPVDLLKPRHWKRLQKLRWLAERSSQFWMLSIGLAAVLLLAPYIHWVMPEGTCEAHLYGWLCQSFAFVFFALGFFLVSMLLVYSYYFARNLEGAATLQDFTHAINALLAQKIPASDGKTVTFGDLRKHGKPLKIVASDIENQRLRLFSTENESCNDIPVAQAVAASSAIPFLFRPVKIQGKSYVDGGMVSNLPAWAFDEQLIEDEKCWVVTSESVQHNNGDEASVIDVHDSRRLKGLKLFQSVSMTGLFGASDLNTRAIGHQLSFQIPVDIGLLDFDTPSVKCALEIDKASIICRGLIQARKQEVEFLEWIAGEAVVQLSEQFGGHDLGLRCALVQEVKISNNHVVGYHLWATNGFETCADDNLKLSRAGTMIDECLRTGKAVSADLDTEEGQRKFFGVGRPGYLESMTPSDRRWSMAVPLKGSTAATSGLGRVSVAVAFDGKQPIQGRLENVIEILTDLVEAWNSPSSELIE